MPFVTLLKPRRLNYLGQVWERGEEVEVDEELAHLLSENPRFKVTGLVTAALAAARPANREDMLAAIREAADKLDPDDENAFTASGKPHPQAVSQILGYQVTSADMNAALKRAAPAIESADGKTTRSGVRITKVTPKAKEKAAPVETGETGPGEESAEDGDPTTADALEV